MTKRNDVHRPADMRPEDYTYVGVFYQGGARSETGAEMVAAYLAQDSDEQVEAAERLLEEQPFDGNHKRIGTCDHCGAVFAYGVVYKHVPTGEGVAVGHTCAAKAFSYDSRAQLDMARLKKRAKAARERARIEKHAKDTIGELGLTEDFAVDHYIIRDIHARLLRWGKISDKQVALVRKIAKEERERDAKRAEENARRPEPAPVVEGKALVLTGEILGFGEQESDWGIVDKFLFLDDRGFKLYSTAPAALFDLGREAAQAAGSDECASKFLRGKRIMFVADTQKSRKDECFGFGKRPRKVALVEA